jgi:hypothetical protein
MKYNLIPCEAGESKLFYRLDGEAAERHGAIGYMRSDFGRGGGEFWNTWFDIQKKLKTPDFKNELSAVIDSLRNDGQEPPFASRGSLQKFCFVQKGLRLSDAADGFKIQTLGYTYAVYCSPFRGDYDIRVYAYDNRYLLPELAGQHELPDFCYSTMPSSGEIVIIKNGEKGYYRCEYTTSDAEYNREYARDSNIRLGVTKRQEAAMLAGSLFGWDTPAAKPWNYDRDGTARPLPPKEKERDYER